MNIRRWIWFPLWFIPLWFVVQFCGARQSGWSRLEERYSHRGSAPLEAAAGRTIVLRRDGVLAPFTFRRCVHLGFGDPGIFLNLSIPFRPFKPPLLIPWRDVSKCSWRDWGNGHADTILRVRDLGIDLELEDSREAWKQCQLRRLVG